MCVLDDVCWVNLKEAAVGVSRIGGEGGATAGPFRVEEGVVTVGGVGG